MSASFISGVRAIHDALMTSAAWACWAGAAALFHSTARARAAVWCEGLDRAEPARVRRGVALAGTAVAAWVCLLKACQYGGFQLPRDTTIHANIAANLLRGRGLQSTVDGTYSALAVHFAFFVPVFLAPVLLVWRSVLPFVLIQAAATASVGPAAFLLASRRSRSNALGLIAMGLAWSHGSFHQMATASLESAVFAPPLFLWGLVLWEARRRTGAGILWALALTTREQFPFTLAGLGVYHALAADRAPRRRWLEGAGVVVASAAVWALEMRLVGSHGQAINAQEYWARYYSDFGATRGDIIRTVLTRPDIIFARVFWPPAHLAPFAELLAGVAFLPLADPAALAAVVVSGTHHLLQASYDFRFQSASYTFGPLLFAVACGLAALARRPAFSGTGRAWLLAAALAVSGWSLRGAPRVIHPAMGASDARAVADLVRRVPPDASLWADEYAGSWLSARPQIKLFFLTELPPRFDVMLFRPEYVLANDTTLLSLAPADQARLIGFLAREGYAKVAAAGPYVLLRDPQAPRRGWSQPLELSGRPDDASRVRPYLADMLASPEAGASLAAYPPDLRYAPVSVEEHAVFANVLLTRGLAGLAILHDRAALQGRPDFPEVRNNLGNALAAAGDYAGAARELSEALRLRPREGLMAYNLGNVLIRGGKALEAVPVLEQAARYSPGDARILNSLGAAYLLTKRRDEARGAFEKALRLDPALTDARENLKALGVPDGDGPRRGPR